MFWMEEGLKLASPVRMRPSMPRFVKFSKTSCKPSLYSSSNSMIAAGWWLTLTNMRFLTWSWVGVGKEEEDSSFNDFSPIWRR